MVTIIIYAMAKKKLASKMHAIFLSVNNHSIRQQLK